MYAFGVFLFICVYLSNEVYAQIVDNNDTNDILKAEWYYPADGIETWSDSCKGNKQSPIDIIDNDIEKEKTIELKLFNYEKYIVAECQNNGYTVVIKINPEDHIYIIGGEYEEKFVLQQIHFHWNSEHKINGESYPMEVHFVHGLDKSRSKRHSGIAPDDSLHVLAVLYKLSKNNNTAISNVVDIFDSLSKVGQRNSLIFTPKNMLPENTNEYYRYFGSLTTPGCNEIVQWTIFSSHMDISQEQYDVIWRTKTFNGSFSTNFRHTQPLNNRTLKFMSSSTDHGQTVTNTLVFFLSMKAFSIIL